MEVEVKGNVVNVKGNIKSLDDVYKLKSVLDSINYSSITINLYDSMAITSTLIGYLRKKINDGIQIFINVGNELLYELLDDLGLIDIFHVRKIK